jgi:nucleoside-diphosphate-sugar epimerase
VKTKRSDKKRVLVTGAAGFIGGRCLPILVSNDFEVHAVDISTPKMPDGLYWHQVDLLDPRQTYELLASIQPTHLLHLAWYAKPGDYWNSTENVRWVEGSLHLLRAFQQSGGKRVVMAGTCAEYDWGEGYCSEYTTSLNPSTLYGTCKNALQHIVKDFSQVTELSSAWGRLFFLYGPYENPNRLVSSIIIDLLRHKKAPCSHGEQLRDFLHVEDVASAFVALLMSDVIGPVNIASGLPIAIKDVIFLIADTLGERKLIGLGEIPVNDKEPQALFADTKRLSREVLWSPRYDIKNGIQKTIEWWRNLIWI